MLFADANYLVLALLLWGFIFLTTYAPVIGLVCIVPFVMVFRNKQAAHRNRKLILLTIAIILLIVPGLTIRFLLYDYIKDGLNTQKAETQSFVNDLDFEVYQPSKGELQAPSDNSSYIFVSPSGNRYEGVFMGGTERASQKDVITQCDFSTQGDGWKASAPKSLKADKTCRDIGTLKSGEKVYAQKGEIDFNDTGASSVFYGTIKGSTLILIDSERETSIPVSKIDSSVLDWLNTFEPVKK